MSVSMIVAVSENGVIGNAGSLPWRLSRDLIRFKQLTSGHCLIMGRTTFETLPGPLPNRVNIIISRNPNYRAPGAIVVSSIEAALNVAGHDSEPFVAGGSQIYRVAEPLASRAYVTRVHANVDGDVRFADLDTKEWQLVSEEHHGQDAKNSFPVTFLNYKRFTPVGCDPR